MQERLAGFKPMCFLQGKLYLYHKGGLYVLQEETPHYLFPIYPQSWKEATRLTARFFRCEPKYAVPLEDTSMLMVGKRQMLLINVATQKITRVADARTGFSDPLNVCPASGKWIAIWGDYGSNPQHEEIHIYGLTPENKIEILYTFAAGQVRHVHNVVPKKSGGYYIFTGDQEEKAGIYETDFAFQTLKPLYTGKQQYRAVIGFDTDYGLLYATDAVNEQNYIYLLRPDGKNTVVAALNGSCIYGTKHAGKYYFSTTVEPDENNRGLLSWISYKRGQGILSNSVSLLEVDQTLQSKCILEIRKDWLPMKLMQYGAIQFPRGNSGQLWCYPVAVQKYDGAALMLNLYNSEETL